MNSFRLMNLNHKFQEQADISQYKIAVCKNLVKDFYTLLFCVYLHRFVYEIYDLIL